MPYPVDNEKSTPQTNKATDDAVTIQHDSCSEQSERDTVPFIAETERSSHQRTQATEQQKKRERSERMRLRRKQKREQALKEDPVLLQNQRDQHAARQRLLREKWAQGGVESEKQNYKAREAERSRKRRYDEMNNTYSYEQRKKRCAEKEKSRRALRSEEQKKEDAERKRKRRKQLLQSRRDDHKRSTSIAWRMINQFEKPLCNEEVEALQNVSKDYTTDLKEFRDRIHAPLKYKVCSVCGIRKEIKVYVDETDSVFDCLRQLPKPKFHMSDPQGDSFWWRFYSPSWDNIPNNTLPICYIC